MLKLLLPVRDVFITQPFGANFVDFYQKLGMTAHNGTDFRAKDGCPVLAAHNGIVAFAGTDGDGGISVAIEFIVDDSGYKTIYYHLRSHNVIKGEAVCAGDIIGYADNTGKYTTGSHLHFGLKFIENGKVKDYNNGYFGAVDPAPYFEARYGKYWDKPAAFHRYGRKQDWKAEWTMRFKNVWLHKRLIKINMLSKINDTEFINALVYGGWSFEDAINPAMYEIWSNLKKNEYVDENKRPFI